MTYIIGDVHGNFKTLIDLHNRLNNDEFVFVGDLIDRGKYSREVIKFVRENDYLCTLGNHEKMMIDYGKVLLKHIPHIPVNYIHSWLNSGGKETLLSYDLIKVVDGSIFYNEDSIYLNDFKKDLAWLETLPLFLEFPFTINNRKVVVSHSCISNVWERRDDLDYLDEFEEYALWHRDDAEESTSIYNVFGHTPMPFGVDKKGHYTNLDTGCYKKKEDYGLLSAYCLETQEVISINRNKED